MINDIWNIEFKLVKKMYRNEVCWVRMMKRREICFYVKNVFLEKLEVECFYKFWGENGYYM